MPRGGRRSGTPGKAYSNRTDMNTNRAPGIVRIPGQAYGMQAQQVAAQRTVPVGPTPTASAPSPAPAAPTGTTAAPSALASLIPLDAPTTRPDEPVTAGSPSGPGPGPAAPAFDPATATAGDLLRAIAPNSPELAQLYDYLAGGGQ